MTSGRDEYYNRAKQEGYRARSAYKLQQIDAAEQVFDRGDTVVDLGAAPGGWLQVAAEEVGDGGLVVGVDRQRIDELDHDNVETVQGDMTDERTLARLRDTLGVASAAANDERERSTLGSSSTLQSSDELGGEDGVGDDDDEGRDSTGADGDRSGPGSDTGRVATDPQSSPVDVVISDMAPNMTGEYELDHARSIHLAGQALETALSVLTTGGDFVVKVFDGRDLSEFREEIGEEFEYVRSLDPDASRQESSERYLIGKNRLDAPVAEGERREVEITGEGEEGDGIAYVEGYTLFVPGAEQGETVSVTVTDVKANFGFAELVE